MSLRFTARLRTRGIEIRRAQPTERRVIVDWAQQHFPGSWTAECEAALEQRPVTCFIAAKREPAVAPNVNPSLQPDESLVGVVCYDATRRGMFGPEGVHERFRGLGIATPIPTTHERSRSRGNVRVCSRAS
ncbi:MAG TPA: hypothetical protein VMW17_03115 [Candidatus Binatia bacterium]|nr:hypothetical protein [Candidatus Binatia bacterium]